ncbi:MAG: hypothetical protein FWC47_13735 [Oscillospiraceae bacterium]|nr:hypothetical protein [Oscillospiraceae bacterium]
MGLENRNSIMHRIKSLSLEERIQNEIFRTGFLVNNKDKFKERASISTNIIDKENIPNLISYLFNPMEKVSDFKSRFTGDEEYISVIEDSIFEILYNFKEMSVPYLKDMVLNSNLKIKVKAMNILTRIAKDSKEKESIVSFINENIDDLRYEVIIPTLYFISFIKDSKEVLDIYNRFFTFYDEDYGEYADALYVLENMYLYDKNAITPFLPTLKEYALNKNFRKRPTLNGIFVRNMIGDDNDEINFCFYESLDEVNNIRAALFYTKIVPNDDDIYNRLSYWYNQIQDKDLKNKIECALRKYSAIKEA